MPRVRRRCTNVPRSIVSSVTLLVLLGACSTENQAATTTTDSATGSAGAVRDLSAGVQTVPAADTEPTFVMPPEPPARDADQRFLRRLLDRHEMLSAMVHERMMMRHDDHDMKAGMPMEPARNTGRVDQEIDSEKDAIVAALRKLYRDEHRAVLPGREQRRADSLARNAPTTGDSAYRQQLITGLRSQLALIERSLPTLRRAEVRALARNLAVEIRARAKMFAAAARE